MVDSIKILKLSFSNSFQLVFYCVRGLVYSTAFLSVGEDRAVSV